MCPLHVLPFKILTKPSSGLQYDYLQFIERKLRQKAVMNFPSYPDHKHYSHQKLSVSTQRLQVAKYSSVIKMAKGLQPGHSPQPEIWFGPRLSGLERQEDRQVHIISLILSHHSLFLPGLTNNKLAPCNLVALVSKEHSPSQLKQKSLFRKVNILSFLFSFSSYRCSKRNNTHILFP